MQKLLSACLLLALSASLAAQNARNFFAPIAEDQIAQRGSVERLLIPKQYKTFELNLPGMASFLAAAPMEFTAAARTAALGLALPQPDGSFEAFAVWETQIMAPELAAKFPQIRTYAGRSLDGTGKIVRLTISPFGLRAKLFTTDAGAQLVEMFGKSTTSFYMAYDRHDTPESAHLPVPPSSEAVDNQAFETAQRFVPEDLDAAERGTLVTPVNLKVYRFAVTNSLEFAQDNGNTVASVLAKIVDITNQVSGVFERDMELRLQLIGQEDKIIFVDPNNNHFSGCQEVGCYMGACGSVIDPIIFSANYDVAHVYVRYLGGNAAGVAGGITCTQGKARGCSSGGGQYGDDFENIVGQEVGHQMSGGHTWNRCGDIGGRAGNTAYEPGSGSTIMSYAGSCGSDNVQNYSDLYYHGGSIEEIKNFYENGTGHTCGAIKATTNNYPDVTLPYQDGFNIPIKTPFELNGSATDVDAGDDANLTYCWEQVDIGPECALQTPTGSAPLFRTLPMVKVTNRYFPRLQTVILNTFDVKEQLPTITRDMTFRMTVRDNHPDGGGTTWKDVAFKATALAGPFVVKSPNLSNEIWRTGELAHVIWEVANTDKFPVSCARVNIRLSLDGGQTYPITLASGVANDGSEYITVPDTVNAKARVRIDAAGNVFYDISNNNFKIQKPTVPALSLGLESDGGQICLPGSFSTKINSVALLGFDKPTNLELTGLPPGATASFGTSQLQPGQSTDLTIDLTKTTLEGTWNIDLVATGAGQDTLHRSITLTTVSNDFSQLELVSPADGATGLGQSQTLRWNAVPDANTYDLQISTSPKFLPGTILYAPTGITVDFFNVPAQLAKSKAFFWRVRPVNECGQHDWTEAFFFATKVDNCTTTASQDLPKALSPNDPSSFVANIYINIPGTVSVLNVKEISGFHQAFKDLDVRLTSPSGTEVLLFKNKCGSNEYTFKFGMTDDAPNAFQCPPGLSGQNFRPTGHLSDFAGQSFSGTWKLTVKDVFISGGGTIDEFKLEFCSAASLNPPYLVNNQVLQLDPGTNSVIDIPHLLVEDANNTHPQLTYTLLSVPKHGSLRLNFGGDLVPGDTLTQAQIDAGDLRFFDWGSQGTDGFRFMVSDNEGGWLPSTLFKIHTGVDATGEAQTKLGFSLNPNPAVDATTLVFEKAVDSNTRVQLFSTTGQLLQSTQLNSGSDRLRISLAGLPQGIYVLTVENAEGRGVRKLVRE